MSEDSDLPQGTQSIARAVTMLRVLATRARFGWALSELATAAGLKKATAHRILARLEHEGLVHRRGLGDHYFLGSLAGELSLAIPGFHDFIGEARGFAGELARKTGLVTVLSLRSGDHFVVAARVGSPRLKSELNEQGSYRPLVSTAGGNALLITLPAARQRAIVERNGRQMASRGHTRIDDCHAMWQRSRRLGFGSNFGDIAPGTNAVAVGVPSAGPAFISVTLAGPDTQLGVERCHALVPFLREQGDRLRAIAAQVHPGLYQPPTA
ncbi:MAG TPA: helix-turn-helix domain-containing protein [Ramlibacter sp.]|nr:helix-turn-helix domain-containing protein [Ramlibacter sp.]